MNPNYYNMYNKYYGEGKLNYRHSDSQMNSEEIIDFIQAVELIKQSIDDEKEDEMFYETLIEQAPTQKEKDIIKSIKDDEVRHNQILKDLYHNFTGEMIESTSLPKEITEKLDYTANLEKALFGELDAVEKYRRILGIMPSGDSYTLIMSNMTDELRHANKYNFLIHNASHSM